MGNLTVSTFKGGKKIYTYGQDNYCGQQFLKASEPVTGWYYIHWDDNNKGLFSFENGIAKGYEPFHEPNKAWKITKQER